MGQFKPMVKMQTTEPSVELKLKKGGKVMKKEKKMQMGGPSAGGDMTLSPPPGAQPMAGLTPPPGGMPAMPGRRPKKPNMFARRRAMNRMAGMGDGGASDADMMMQAIESAKEQGMGGGMGGAPAMKKGGESKAAHAAEMKKMASTEKKLKQHAAKPASKAHKGLNTGGVVDGQGGYKAGGIIKTTAKKTTKMDTARPDRDQGPTGGVKLGNAGGYRDGGKVEKYQTGGVAMAQAGYKKGGGVKKPKATGKIASGAPVAMPQGRKPAPKPVEISRLAGTYKKGGRIMTPAEKRLDKIFQKENAPAMKAAKKMSNEKYGKKMAYGGTPEAVTETERSVTVVPGKKSGGRMAKGGSC